MKMSELNIENRSCLTCRGMCRTRRKIVFTIRGTPEIDPMTLTEVLKIIAEACRGYRKDTSRDGDLK